MSSRHILDMGGEGRDLLFAHANGYPPAAYRQLFSGLARDFRVRALEQRPLWGERQPPRNLDWSLFADDLLKALDATWDRPVWVMGHSMGATAAVLAASRRPERFAGLILLDPVFLPERFVLATRLLPRRRRERMPMIRRALQRPEYFESREAAFAFYREKRAFRGFSDAALRDYIDASKAEEDGRLRLRYSGAWEAAVYGSPPLVRRCLKRLRVPTIGLRGRDSDTLMPEVFARWRRWQPGAQLAQVPGGHLFPLEHPQACAGAIRNCLFPAS
jgi:pimeloyl-ACP methyl ester carboxylesterase